MFCMEEPALCVSHYAINSLLLVFTSNSSLGFSTWSDILTAAGGSCPCCAELCIKAGELSQVAIDRCGVPSVFVILRLRDAVA